MDWTDELIEASRRAKNVPDDWEWYLCAGECGDIVWVPPETGDLPMSIVCGEMPCMLKVITSHKPVPKHYFDSGHTGLSTECNYLVLRNGAGDNCGLPRDHPIHS